MNALPSNRNFGGFFSIALAVIGTLLIKDYAILANILWLIAAITGLITWISPESLTSLNRYWFKLGEGLGRIVSPVTLGVIFFVLITPVALISRMFGRDELRLIKRPSASYWIERIPPGPSSDSYKNQY